MKKIVALLLLLTAFTAFANADRLEPRAGEGIYLVVLGDKAKELDLATLGGRVLKSWSDRRIVALPEHQLTALQKHEGLVFVQRIWTGVSQAAVVPEPASMSTGTPPSWSTGTYQYDASGHIKAMGSDTFGYDQVARVIRANVKGLPQEYAYDRFGNLTRLGGTTLTASTATNQLGGFAYDGGGNVTRDHAGRNYYYDAFGMITAVDTTPGDTVGHDLRMIYNSGDERIIVEEGSSTIRYRLRDSEARLLREWKATSGGVLEWERDYLYAASDLVAGEVQIDQRQNGQRHYHTDHLGSNRLVTDGAGALVARNDYLPFGEEIPPTISEWTNTGKAPRDPRKFAGHERDYFSVANVEGEVLDYMHARYYSPTRGRFLSVDPTWESADLTRPQSWNRYTYVDNDPINKIDPDGRNPLGALLGAAINVSIESYKQVTSGRPVDNRRLGAALLNGAIAGATGGLGAASVRGALAAGAAGGVLGGAAERLINKGEKVFSKAMITDAVGGAVGGVVGRKVGQAMVRASQNSGTLNQLTIQGAAQRAEAAAANAGLGADRETARQAETLIKGITGAGDVAGNVSGEMVKSEIEEVKKEVQLQKRLKDKQ